MLHSVVFAERNAARKRRRKNVCAKENGRRNRPAGCGLWRRFVELFQQLRGSLSYSKPVTIRCLRRTNETEAYDVKQNGWRRTERLAPDMTMKLVEMQIRSEYSCVDSNVTGFCCLCFFFLWPTHDWTKRLFVLGSCKPPILVITTAETRLRMTCVNLKVVGSKTCYGIHNVCDYVRVGVQFVNEHVL